MDGVDQLNNILIIGMTNRIDMIDEALLRPGRLEVHMEISLPDEDGRLQILSIHTNKMRTNRVMDDDVDLHKLASLTKNFSGAEIGGLIKSATSFAFNRHVKVGTMAGISDDVENLKVNMQDFMNALDEVHPAFGVSEEELEQVVQNGIIHFDTIVDVSTVLSSAGCLLYLFLLLRNFCGPENFLWSKSVHLNEHRWSVFSCMARLDRERRHLRHQLHKHQSSHSSSLFHRIIWSGIRNHRKFKRLPKSSRTVTRVP